MKILAFDQARNCGYTIGETGQKPVSNVVVLGKSGVKTGEYLWRWGQHLKEVIGRTQPDLIAYEVPFFSAATASSGTRLLQMAGYIEGICYGLRIPVMAVNNGSWKKSFCGTAKFNKDTRPYPPILECELRGIEVDNSTDRADSVGIWFHAALIEDPKAMANIDTPLFGRTA